MAELTDIRESVREKYAAAARSAAGSGKAGCCGSGADRCCPGDETGVFGATLYDEATREELPRAALGAALGCGVPTAVADLHDGFTGIELTETHRVHEHAAAAIIRARKPAAPGCCSPEALADCCEPEGKDDCCGAPSVNAPARCGCQA